MRCAALWCLLCVHMRPLPYPRPTHTDIITVHSYLKEGVTPTTAKICFVKHADRRQQPTAYADAQVRIHKAQHSRAKHIGYT